MKTIRILRRSVSRAASRRRPGYEAAVLAAAVDSGEQFVTLTTEAYDGIRDAYRPFCGPGCQLRRLLEWWRIRDDGTCGCREMASQMDTWGPDGCAAREDEILGHLAEAAVRRGLPFVPMAARVLIRRAIDAARQEASHAATQAAPQARADVAGPGPG